MGLCYDRGSKVYLFLANLFFFAERRDFIAPSQLETGFWATKLLEVSIGRDFGALKGIRHPFFFLRANHCHALARARLATYMCEYARVDLKKKITSIAATS